MSTLLLALIGSGFGFLVRWATPFLLGMKETRLPFRYPFIEAIGAAAFFMMGSSLGWGLDQAKWYLLVILLLAVSSADAYTKYIPSLLCYVGTGLGICVNTLQKDAILELLDQRMLLDLFGISPYGTYLPGAALAFLGALTGWILIEFVRRVFRPLVQMDVMGQGDALLLMMIGAFLGPKAVFYSLFPACMAGIVIGGIRMMIYKVPHSAFGPALALGAFVTVLFHSTMIEGYRAFQQRIAELPPSAPLAISGVLVIILLVMLVRMRSKAAEYEQILEAEYAETDKKMK